MSADDDLASIKPTRKDIVFDVVKSLGFDVTDWISTAKNPRKLRANPKYCYDWSFVQPGVVAIFNLWHDAMEVQGDDIVYRDNFRANADFHRRNGGKTKWIMRGEKLDRDVSAAARDRLPVRVIVVDGKRRATENPNSTSSSVGRRQLDPLAWHIRTYNEATGEFLLVRGPGEPEYVDQFELTEVDLPAPERRDYSGSGFVRDSAVRKAALRRAAGKCEYCGEVGFKMESGAIYLETHHVVPLSENGADNIHNVAALCPTDHRRAHFGHDRLVIRRSLLERLRSDNR